jgi:hypothetical protein
MLNTIQRSTSKIGSHLHTLGILCFVIDNVDGQIATGHNIMSTSSPGAVAQTHRIRLRNKKTRVRIPPGYKVFRET